METLIGVLFILWVFMFLFGWLLVRDVERYRDAYARISHEHHTRLKTLESQIAANDEDLAEFNKSLRNHVKEIETKLQLLTLMVDYEFVWVEPKPAAAGHWTIRAKQ